MAAVKSPVSIKSIRIWFSRKLMAYNVVNTMDAFHCVETLKMAIEHFGKPEIFNSDQGSQFTSDEFIGELQRYNI